MNLYSNKDAKQIDQLAASYLKIDSYELMKKAATAIFQHITAYQRILVVTGPGNNGGDGWVIAELARTHGQQVTVWALRKPDELQGDAYKAAKACQADVVLEPPTDHYDCIVDAIFGSGLDKQVTGDYASAIHHINQMTAFKLAVDIPSGLHGDTGQCMGCCVKADQTIAVLTCCPGYYTARGQVLTGQLKLEGLSIPALAYQNIDPIGKLLDKNQLQELNQIRTHDSHKGSYGHVWVAGGQAGMMGAVLLAAHAVLRVGAGSVTSITDPEHCVYVPLYQPEIMSHGFTPSRSALPMKKPQSMAIGMGMGHHDWAEQLIDKLTFYDVPKVYDADALLLIKSEMMKPADVITPHPLEAARLLNCTVDEIQSDRLTATQLLHQKYKCVVVLKGSGTIIKSNKDLMICSRGSHNLATAGSGDVLAGMIAGLIAQGHESFYAAQMAVLWHAITGECSAQKMCLTASGILEELPIHLPA